MGREIRKVTKNWQHPKNQDGNFHPCYDEYYGDAIEDWIKNHNLWITGKHPDQLRDDPPKYKFYTEWGGGPPELEYYRQEKWSEDEANCYQFYETVSEGTPLSPVFESLSDLENWLVENEGYSRSAAHNFCKDGWAPSFVLDSRGLRAGIEALDNE